jgi:hypothetical protein
MVRKAVVDRQLHRVTDTRLMPLVQQRFDDMMALRNPTV